MSIVRKIKRALRGEVDAKTAALEVWRRSNVTLAQKRERARLALGGVSDAHLSPAFASMPKAELVNHFRKRTDPHFLAGFASSNIGAQQRILFAGEIEELLLEAAQIVDEHSWSILGLGKKHFGTDIEWNLDPVSGVLWPLEYHADMKLIRGDGSDVRVLWELNRLAHFLTLARAYALTGDERFTAEFLLQLEGWRAQNPYGYGANWNCAMEVALRAINLLGAFEVFKRSSLVDESQLSQVLTCLGQHGTFIRENLEFSYVATSNHYLSDVVGLVWLGIMLPELEAAASWRDFGLRQMLREMDKQVLEDGADFESSTGYHRFVLELFLYSFILCRANKIDIEERYWQKLKTMLSYVRAYLRPDGRAPLIGDSDGGQLLPIRQRDADDHAYVLAVGAVVFEDPNLLPEGTVLPEEVLWILGENGVNKFEKLKPAATTLTSVGFPDAGIYFLREGDLSLSFNVSGPGIHGRGSHGHNDALSIEVSACGAAFVVDPGTYVYTGDLKERHQFRSTAYHSTVEIDGVEQNTIDEQTPFVIGNETRPRTILWETGLEFDRVSAEHYGYARLPQPVTHRRTVTFNKLERWWLIEDEFFGLGEHSFAARFHLNSGMEVDFVDEGNIWVHESESCGLLIASDLSQSPELESQFTSKNYKEKTASITACWRFSAAAPCKRRWILVPACGHDGEPRSEAALRLKQLQNPGESG
ncbi:MAG TPA: alginate lyase family protein [Pyrinomonadaceae bacterium]|nr:alginate lyase family protein [Pyrinomonadaceae bacterium]